MSSKDLLRFEVVGLNDNCDADGRIVCEAGWGVISNVECAVKIKVARVLRDVKVVAEFRGLTETRWTGIRPMDVGDRNPVRHSKRFCQVVEVVRDKKEPLSPNEFGIIVLPFKITLPKSGLPSSFDDRAGTISYYIKATLSYQDGLRLLKAHKEIEVPVLLRMPEPARVRLLTTPSPLDHMGPYNAEKCAYAIKIPSRTFQPGEHFVADLTITCTPENAALRVINASLRSSIEYTGADRGSVQKFPRPLSEIVENVGQLVILSGDDAFTRRFTLLVDPKIAQPSLESPLISVKTIFRLEIVLDTSETPNIAVEIPVVIVPSLSDDDESSSAVGKNMGTVMSSVQSPAPIVINNVPSGPVPVLSPSYAVEECDAEQEAELMQYNQQHQPTRVNKAMQEAYQLYLKQQQTIIENEQRLALLQQQQQQQNQMLENEQMKAIMQVHQLNEEFVKNVAQSMPALARSRSEGGGGRLRHFGPAMDQLVQDAGVVRRANTLTANATARAVSPTAIELGDEATVQFPRVGNSDGAISENFIESYELQTPFEKPAASESEDLHRHASLLEPHIRPRQSSIDSMRHARPPSDQASNASTASRTMVGGLDRRPSGPYYSPSTSSYHTNSVIAAEGWALPSPAISSVDGNSTAANSRVVSNEITYHRPAGKTGSSIISPSVATSELKMRLLLSKLDELNELSRERSVSSKGSPTMSPVQNPTENRLWPAPDYGLPPVPAPILKKAKSIDDSRTLTTVPVRSSSAAASQLFNPPQTTPPQLSNPQPQPQPTQQNPHQEHTPPASPATTSTSSAKPGGRPNLKKYRVVVDRVAEQMDELDLAVGQLVVVRTIFEGGWALGVNLETGHEGMFPLQNIEGLHST